MKNRISGHRRKYYECLFEEVDEYDDDHLLGLHLYNKDHFFSKNAFDKIYEFTALELCNPNDLDLKEHSWVQKLKCVAPYGLNSHDPFGIPIIL